jgi:hypothetical protein
MRITPTAEFLEAYRRVTGSDDTSPAAVISAMRSDLADAIRREHAKIMAQDKSAVEVESSAPTKH